jgi:hypothetical protein
VSAQNLVADLRGGPVHDTDDNLLTFHDHLAAH